MSHPWTIPMCCVWNVKRKCASYFRSLSHGTLLQYKKWYMLWRTPFVIANVFSTLRNFPLAIYIVVSYKCSSSLCVKSGWWLHQLHAACVCVAHANTALTNMDSVSLDSRVPQTHCLFHQKNISPHSVGHSLEMCVTDWYGQGKDVTVALDSRSQPRS